MSVFSPQTWLLRYLLRHSEALRSNILLSQIRAPERSRSNVNDGYKAEAWSLLPALVIAAVAKRSSCIETNHDRIDSLLSFILAS